MRLEYISKSFSCSFVEKSIRPCEISNSNIEFLSNPTIEVLPELNVFPIPL